MNKQDTAANREWLASVIASAPKAGEGTQQDRNRSAVLAAVGTRKERERDGLVDLFETMQGEAFEAAMIEDANRNAPSLCECL